MLYFSPNFLNAYQYLQLLRVVPHVLTGIPDGIAATSTSCEKVTFSALVWLVAIIFQLEKMPKMGMVTCWHMRN